MATVKKIIAREIFDSRGNPTIEAKMTLSSGEEVSAAAPSGESLGKYECVELRDQNLKQFGGLGVSKAVSVINELLAKKLVGVAVEKHIEIDDWLIKADGTENCSKLGVNSIMTVSQLFLKGAAASHALPLYKYILHFFNQKFARDIKLERLPGPIFNMINGGAHGNANLDFQEFQIVPSTSLAYSKALEMGVEAYAVLKKVLLYRNAGISVSEEGGFTPSLLTNANALDLIKETLIQKKLQLGVDVSIGIDFAAAQYFSDGKYRLKDKQNAMKIDEYIKYLAELAEKYNFIYLEDPLDQEDFPGWTKLNELIGEGSYIVGDDFIAGNIERLARAVKEKCCSAILIKFNQVSTFSRLFAVVNGARAAGLKVIISHRLGETNDSILADLAVGLQADFVKFGPPVRGERVAKYNRLLEIEEEMLHQI